MHHGHSKSDKEGGSGEKLTKAEMNTKLFDDQRKYIISCVFLGPNILCVWHLV